MPAARILIVEDEGLVAEDLRLSLSNSGYDVVGIADTFDSAYALASESLPDLALLDIRLKGTRDGIELAEELRRCNVGHVYLTSHSDEGTLARAERTEPLGYILKPFRTREILPVLRTALYRQASERRVRGLERWLSTVLRSIGDAVLVTDRQALVTYMNPVAERLTGMALRDVVGLPLVEALPIISGDPSVPIACIASRCMEANATLHLEPDAQLLRNDGVLVPIGDCASPIIDDSGNIAGAVVVAYDATEQRETAKQQRAADHRMLEAERIESAALLASGLAHDINNALTAILGNLSLCRSDSDHDRSTAIDAAERSARTAGALCQRMLEKHATKVRIEEVDLEQLVQDVVQTEAQRWHGRLSIETTKEMLGLTALADPVQIRQVLQNLVGNASEAAASNDGNHVVVRSGQISLPSALLGGRRAAAGLPPGRYIWIEVSDDGPGMPPEVAARVFEPFFTTKINGNGLGLASSSVIVSRHGGAIEVETEVGIGTVFRVFLPQAAQELGAVAEALAQQPHASVMLVDDDESVRQVIRRLLVSRGWQCLVTGTAAEALRLLQEQPHVDALIVDGTLEGRPIAPFLAAARAVHSDLPVLIVSGAISNMLPNADAQTALLAKPFLIEELIERLWHLVRRTPK